MFPRMFPQTGEEKPLLDAMAPERREKKARREAGQ